ncbi:unnamed protein product [Durusdinium trenchii]
MYWKVGKDFVDGRLWHLLDSVFANDPSDRYGVLQFLGPSGPFVFGMKNCAFLGRSPPGIAALAAGQHCGLRGGAGPCNVQYLLENIDFSKMHAQQPRLAFGANSNVGDAAVLPVFVTKDRSLGGFRSIVSSHLNGFAAAGCVPIDSTWAKDALGCEVSLRRLNIWGDDAGVLTLVGPGFNVVRDMTFPAEGRNGGDIKYDGVRNGYGSLVLSGQDYELTGLFNGPDRSWIVEFSDPVLDDYFGTDWVNLRVGGETCQLRQSDDRSFICAMGEFGGLCNSRTLSSHNIIAAGHVRCADGSPNPTPSPPSPSSTHTSSTVSQTTSTTSSSASTSRQAPVLFPPISGGSANWALHRELNCWDGHGARSLPNSNPLLGTYTVEGCREQCEMNLECEAAVIAKHVSTPKFPCFLRTILQISQCRDYADFDVWEIRRTTVTASTTSRSTVVTSATSTTTSITSSASSTSSSSSGDFVPVDGGIDRACRGASSGDNSPSYYVIQNGISGLEGCKAICIIDALCQGIEYSTGRCELWVRPGGIEATAAVSGFICLRYTGAPTTTPSPWSFFPVDGGVNRACRGRSVNDNLASYYHVAASRGMSLTQCQAACAELAGCQGIEHNQGGRCELWTKSIQATRSLTGYTCLRFDAWRLYQGSNCYEGHGGSLLHYITEKISVDGCKAECLKKDHCEGISVRSGWEESPCWLYTQINLNSCVLDYPDYDFWHRLQ